MPEPTLVDQRACDWTLWVLPKVERFPKSYPFSVGQNLVQHSLDLLTNLVDATYETRNAEPLAQAVRNINRVRFLVRLSKDLNLIEPNSYEFASKGLDEIGRMTGGWRKSRGGKMNWAGNLWPRVVAWDNILNAALAAARGKRRRPDVTQFLADLEPNVCELQRELESGSYRPGPYRTFRILDPKPRQISAATFRDRVVHHAHPGARTRVRKAIPHASFASRKAFGQHAALRKARAACAQYPCVLKCDVRKYFPSIDHSILAICSRTL